MMVIRFVVEISFQSCHNFIFFVKFLFCFVFAISQPNFAQSKKSWTFLNSQDAGLIKNVQDNEI